MEVQIATNGYAQTINMLPVYIKKLTGGDFLWKIKPLVC